MIVYSLLCAEGHEFEGWFRDSAAFDEQSISRNSSVPSARSRSGGEGADGAGSSRRLPAAADPKPPVREEHSAPQEMRKMRQFMTGLRKYVEQNADYVGPRFPEEARKIHYGETEERQIYGEASLKDVKELIDEGVDVAPLPPDLSEAN